MAEEKQKGKKLEILVCINCGTPSFLCVGWIGGTISNVWLETTVRLIEFFVTESLFSRSKPSI